MNAAQLASDIPSALRRVIAYFHYLLTETRNAFRGLILNLPLIAQYSSFLKIFNACWRESVRPPVILLLMFTTDLYHSSTEVALLEEMSVF